jgi:hypothetical protein
MVGRDWQWERIIESIAFYCTVSVTGTEFTVVLSVAVITILECVPGMVAGLDVSVACPNTVGSATEVVVMVTLVGRSVAH